MEATIDLSELPEVLNQYIKKNRKLIIVIEEWDKQTYLLTLYNEWAKQTDQAPRMSDYSMILAYLAPQIKDFCLGVTDDAGEVKLKEWQEHFDKQDKEKK